MFESTTGPERPSRSGWFAVLAATLFLTAAALLAACGGEPQPGSPAGPAAAPDTTGTNTPVPTEGSGTAATVRASTQPGSPAEPAARAQPSDTVEPGDAPRLDTGTPGEDREGSGDATEPGTPDGDTAPQSDEVEGAGADQPPEPAPDGDTAPHSDEVEGAGADEPPEPAPHSELGPLGRAQRAEQLTGPLLYVDAELGTPTVTAEVDGSSIFFMAEDAQGYNRTVVELEGIGLWEAVTPEDGDYIDIFTVPAPTLETVRWRVAAAIAPEDAGGRYRIGPWTNWSVLGVPQVVPPHAGVDREDHPLAGTSWALVSVGGGPAIGNVEVKFSAGSRISGWTGCNSYDGRYRASRSSFTIEELYWTEAGCPSHEMFLQESLYTDLLVDAAEFAISGSRLTITSSDGRTITFALRQ